MLEPEFSEIRSLPAPCARTSSLERRRIRGTTRITQRCPKGDANNKRKTKSSRRYSKGKDQEMVTKCVALTSTTEICARMSHADFSCVSEGR